MKQELRYKVLQRDMYTCKAIDCETITNKPLHVHHIIPSRLGGKDELENLITYCYKCHKKYEPSRAKPKVISTMVQFSKELTETLRGLGQKGETYEEIVWRLIKGYRGGNKHKQ